VPILVFLGLSVLDLGPMYATDRQTSDSTSLYGPAYYGWGQNNMQIDLGLIFTVAHMFIFVIGAIQIHHDNDDEKILNEDTACI